MKGLRLACGGFATLASTIIPVTSGEGVTSQGGIPATLVYYRTRRVDYAMLAAVASYAGMFALGSSIAPVPGGSVPSFHLA